MGLRTLQILTVILALTVSTVSFAQNSSDNTDSDSSSTSTTTTTKKIKKNHIDVDKDVDTLGGNDALLQKAKAIDPENRARIVQKRVVDRNDRFEFGLNYGAIANGETYLNTQSVGASIDFHINPRWSVGVRYYDYGNQLSAEGQRVFNLANSSYANGGATYVTPDIDYPQQAGMAVIDWYPIYGKINLLDMGIIQFDTYLLAGGGAIQLSSGWTSIYTGGLGFGIWLNQHFTTRIEAKYQTYEDTVITGPRTINGIVGTIGFGFML